MASASAAPPSAPAGGCPPPPPPGPPPPSLDISGPSSGGGDAAAGNRNALFAALNKGSDITRGRWCCVQDAPVTLLMKCVVVRLITFLTFPGLKHVSDDEKTHKNPALRGQGASVRTGPKPFSSPSGRPAPSAAPSAAPTRTLPPVLELDGKKWKVVSCPFIYTKKMGNESGCEGRRSLFRLIYVFCRRTKRGHRTW